jgi:type II restriction enzyme
MKLTASDLATAIDQLPKGIQYNYINPKNQGKIVVSRVQLPEGPVRYKRFNPSKGGTPRKAKEESLSTGLLWRVANAVNEGIPFTIERIVGSSYNGRSVLESLLACSPQFHCCYPGRIEITNSTTNIKKGHKHLVWTPDSPHAAGTARIVPTELVISEMPTTAAVYEALILPDQPARSVVDPSQRRHAQIQIALVLIGRQLGFKTHVARNDQGIIYNSQRLVQMPGVVGDMTDSSVVVSGFADAIHAARLIDVVWFRNARFMPAVIEVEHSTGVTSGLSRMKQFQDKLPRLETRWVIAAPDEYRAKVIQECNKPQFQSLDAKFLPYSAVEELLSLCQRRNVKGVTDDFLDCFMEKTLQS